MSPPDFEQFAAAKRAAGFDEVLAREWPPLTVLDEHTHDFALQALLVRGEMWLSVAGRTRHLRPGDAFELAHGEPHAERYGAEGACYWVARRAADK
ncbi:cupin domain-containing protein [Roseateles violae]|uniref:AraC family ligand binding domain-containing protein n=1 Tax=Roseateles violae TaxID=3058042 RepID=A0ABT8DQ99_9BURK|nr:AraC family ligand binding domain-containing protein [Pelomonas sp. PFR6]MDN3920525.1 AraC family ligand binding domain-containing protein [Pelomonas sp. PFR6]